eukprot:1159521-Pelagomonas_calceolata.AAC.6
MFHQTKVPWVGPVSPSVVCVSWPYQPPQHVVLCVWSACGQHVDLSMWFAYRGHISRLSSKLDEGGKVLQLCVQQLVLQQWQSVLLRWSSLHKQAPDAAWLEVAISYRRACLEHHPDKKLTQNESPEEKQRVEDHFKLVMGADMWWCAVEQWKSYTCRTRKSFCWDA